MEQLLQDVQKLLESKTIEAGYHDYIRIFERIHGDAYKGCRCKKRTLYNIIYNWFQTNKPPVIDDHTGLPKK